MKVQVLYDLREKYEFCSGNDLHDFFRAQAGEPSPSGRIEISLEKSYEFVLSCCENSVYNAPSCKPVMQACITEMKERIEAHLESH